jgi:hypothetical protein
MRWRMVAALLLAAGTVCLSAGCGKDDGSGKGSCSATAIDVPSHYEPDIDPADFTSVIDNPYLPWIPGTVFTYDGTSDGEAQHNVVTVTDQTRTIMGVTCVAVDDRVEVDGELEERTTDWYAQDEAGNVWYFGEDSKEYEGGQVTSTEGSWLAGVDGAMPGIVMEATSEVGDSYRQEYLRGEAEDRAQVKKLGKSVSVPYGSFDDVLVIREWTPLEPCVAEDKWYAADVGLLGSTMTAGGQEDMQLVSITHGDEGAAGAGGAS